ncbi:hypothetical protein QTJ16_003647 [Diplocarpon rosae]|uniref:Heterokaryon incompatibility domain-containing protein n=1 Tax=Diplocarpon rosae TaxID=946125 RepID=A0AAD9SZP5_9HELO|nr:hypothetical protein QTJ16_003647 [Diplocarpon rosae]
MGPIFGLVPELDARIVEMEDAAQPLRDTITALSQAPTINENSQAIDGVEIKSLTALAPASKLSTDLAAKQEKFNVAFSVVLWHLLKPSFAALAMLYLDLLLGSPLKWIHVTAFAILSGGLATLSKKRLATPLIMFTILTTLPFVSKSAMRIFGTYLCLDTFFTPLLWYAYEDISDCTEIRWVMIGCALDIVYVGTGLLTVLFGPILVILAATASWLGICVIAALTLNPGWTIALARAAPEFQTPGKPFESIPRYVLQLVMFRLNRVVRYSIRKFETLAQWHTLKDESHILWNGANPYHYRSLKNEVPKNKRHFRLLRILKGNPSDRVACRLEVVSLDHPGEYEAVSYVWGDPTKSRSISIDGLNLSITKSAYDIIHRRRSAWQDRLVWVDQVCINQEVGDGNLEKQYQVQMMREIYQGAVRVMAFLRTDVNNSGADSNAPMPLADAYLVQSHFAELSFRHEILGHDPETFKSIYQHESKAAQWDALVAFFANPWFRRVWIIQEAVFARNLIIFYDDICLDWKYLARATNILYDQYLTQRFQSADPFVYSRLRADYNMGLHNADSMLEFRGEAKYGHAFTLGYTLKMCAHAGSTDPRDKIYALLGMTTDSSRETIYPEYGREVTPCMVYTRAMRLILSQSSEQQNDERLHTLTLAGIGFDRQVLDLPSWVPDWSQTSQPQFRDLDYWAGIKYPADAHFLPENPSVLHLRGFCFDRIKHLSEPLTVDPAWMFEAADVYLKDWFQTIETLARSAAQNPYPYTHEPILEAFVRTVIGNSGSYGKNSIPSTEQCLADYAAFCTWFEQKAEILARIGCEDVTTPATDFDRQILDMAERRSRFHRLSGIALLDKRFCVSARGRMAAVPPRCKPGDILAIINGARMPYVLRENGGENFSIVGCCYVHGAMYGETPSEEMQRFVIT